MIKQTGFTLVEAAIVLVIVGVLLGGILKGHELIAGARVHNLIETQDQVHAAYLAFLDRYRALPGDYSSATANIPNVTGCGGNGNGDGRIEDATATPSSPESTLAWEHLSKASLIDGSYTCNAAESGATTPVNPFGLRLHLVWDARYADQGAGSPAPRHSLKTGNQIPSPLLAEMDRKIDDGNAASGSFRFSEYTAGSGAPDPQRCFNQSGGHEWNSATSETNCGGASLF